MAGRDAETEPGRPVRKRLHVDVDGLIESQVREESNAGDEQDEADALPHHGNRIGAGRRRSADGSAATWQRSESATTGACTLQGMPRVAALLLLLLTACSFGRLSEA